MQLSHSESASFYTRESEITEKSGLSRFSSNKTIGNAQHDGLANRCKAFLCSFQGLLCVCGAILCIKYLPKFIHWIHPHYWDAPKTWDSCQNTIGQHWAYMGSPCVDHDDALCTYTNTALFSWCNGRYYFTEEGSGGKWTEFAANGVLSAIWTAGDDCDELGLVGWEDACQIGDIDDGNNNNNVECRLNQLRGYLYCGNGASFTYSATDGSYEARDVSGKLR